MIKGPLNSSADVLDLILELLDQKNGWCSLEEIAGKTSLTESETLTLLDFLAKYGFATVDTHKRKARVDPRIHEFLEEIRQTEIEESTSVPKSEEISLSNHRMP